MKEEESKEITYRVEKESFSIILLGSLWIALIASCAVYKVELDFINTQSTTVANKIILMVLNNSLISDYAWRVLIGRYKWSCKGRTSGLHYRAVSVKIEKWLEWSPGCHKTSHNGKTWLRSNLGLTVYLAASEDTKRQPIPELRSALVHSIQSSFR